jgi:demethylmenaquinone methyltransferase/2-methoxy-6-polyprenyl-1,4-benzoquinol methylase
MPIAGETERPAWTAPELAKPHESSDKPGKVRRMFAAIAASYDLNNRLHSLGRDQTWRRAAVRRANVRPGDRILDVACGTGDLTQAFAATPAAHVTGLDFTKEMLAIAEQKRAALRPERASKITYVEGDAMRLPFPDSSFDIVSIAFGIRNVADPAAALREFARVLKPGGRLVILEFDRPTAPILSRLYDFYTGWLMPRTATFISRDRSGAYRYLPRSVETFMSRKELLAATGEAGFQNVTARPLTMGICVCYRGERA